MSYTATPIESLSINTIRTLSMDAVQAANSGHPGTPMALAPVAYVVFNEIMRYDPSQPLWPDRDRFVLSCGHASMLLYSTLHLCEVKQVDAAGKATDKLAVPLDDIRRFRQLESRCPGHPEHGHTSGVETTTGPLGQGIGNSVGMAVAQRWLAARYNRPSFDLFDYDIYALCSDGDMMEGVGAEAASVAGHLKLSNLCWIYDDNTITIEGHTTLAFSENVAERFAGYGWNVVKVDDVNDLATLRAAIKTFQQTTDRPTLIIVRSVIAYGSPHKHNTAGAHGAPLGEEEVRLTKEAYGWPPDQKFLVPNEVVANFRANIGARGRQSREKWEALRGDYAKKFPEQAKELDLIQSGGLPQDWDAEMKLFPADAKGMATRASSGKVLNQIAKRLPWLVGGSADLAPSTLTLMDGGGDFEAASYNGRNMHFGIREHAMGAIVNGMCLSGLRAFGSTFFVFTDYMRPSMRLAAIMGLPVFWVYTHDSIGVGEDGPTHQPIEHLAALQGDPQSHCHSPRRCQRGGRGLSLRSHEHAWPDGAGAFAAERAHARSREVCRGLRREQGRLCAGRRGRRPAGRDPHRHGHGAFALRGGLREAHARGRQDTGSKPAELGDFRRPAAVLSRLGAAARRNAPRGSRIGRRAGLGQIHRPRRAIPRHEFLRCICSGGCAIEALRVYGRERRQAGKGDSGLSKGRNSR